MNAVCFVVEFLFTLLIILICYLAFFIVCHDHRASAFASVRFDNRVGKRVLLISSFVLFSFSYFSLLSLSYHFRKPGSSIVNLLL